MPLGKGVRFRFKTLPDGTKQRLAFRGDKVVEVVNFSKGGKRGKEHTEAEFRKEGAMRALRGRKKRG